VQIYACLSRLESGYIRLIMRLKLSMNLKKVMRLSTIVFCIVSTVSGTLYAKSSFAQLLATKVEIAKEVRNASEIIKDLEHQKIRLIYDRETLNLTGIPSKLVQKGTTGTVEQILKDAFRGTEIVFEEKASFIVLKKRQQPGRIVGQVRDSNG